MQMNFPIYNHGIILKYNKIIFLSSVVLLMASPLGAQTISQPISVGPVNSPSEYFDIDIDIDSNSGPAIKVKDGSLYIDDSNVYLKSNNVTVDIGNGSNVEISGSYDNMASVISTSTAGRAVYLHGSASLEAGYLKVVADGDGGSGLGASGFVVQGTYGQVNASMVLLDSQIITKNIRGLSVRDGDVFLRRFSIKTGMGETGSDVSSKNHLYGVYGEDNNFIVLSEGTVETWTDHSIGMNFVMDVADTSINRVSVNNTDILTHGNSATGMDNVNTRSSISGGSIMTQGIGSHGIGASNGGVSGWAPSHVIVDGTRITTLERQAYGLVATTGSDIQAKSVNIVTAGDSGVGVYSQGTGRINVNGNGFFGYKSSVTTSGSGAHGVAVMLGSEVNIADTVISTTGANASGVYMAGNNYTNRTLPPAPAPRSCEMTGNCAQISTDESLALEETQRDVVSHSNKVTLTGTTIDVADAAALRVLGGEHNVLDISGSTIRSGDGAGALLLKSEVYNTDHEVGLAEVNVDSSRLFGDIIIDSGEVEFDLKNQSYWAGAATVGVNDQVLHSMSLDGSSAWLLTGNSTVNSLQNSGSIAFFPSNSNFRTLTVNTDFVGTGGVFALNTKLGDDNSETDKLVFRKGVSGDSLLAVRNAGGTGARTDDGIRIVEVGGASGGTFALVSPYRHEGENTVVGGAYTYKLYQGSISDPNDGHWYLRSDFDDDGYQAGVPVYEVYPQFLLSLNGLPTLQQRAGNRYWADTLNALPPQDAGTQGVGTSGEVTQGYGMWGRIEGSHNKLKPHSSTSDASYDYDAYKLQAGVDGLLRETGVGHFIGGFTVHYAHGLANVWSPSDADLGRGRISTDGYGFGGTLTWYGDNGFYADQQAHLTWYRSDLSYQGGQASLKDSRNGGFGYGFSSEIGKRFALDDHWSLTPQAQLQYSNVDFSSFTDVFEAEVSRQRAASLQGRIGISADYRNVWRNDRGGVDGTSVYGIANLYNEFLNGTRVDVSSVGFNNKSERLWAGIGIGGSYSWNNDSYAAFAEGSFNTSLKHFGDSYAYKGTVGLRMKW